MGQGIKLSEDTYRDKSYFIIKELENKNLRVIINSPIRNRIEQELYVGFVDNTNFFTKGIDT